MDTYKCGISSSWFNNAQAKKTKPRNRIEDILPETQKHKTESKTKPDHSPYENISTDELINIALKRQGHIDINIWNILQTKVPKKEINFQVTLNKKEEPMLCINHKGEFRPLETGLHYYTAREMMQIDFDDFDIKTIQKDTQFNIRLLERKFILAASLKILFKNFPDTPMIDLLEGGKFEEEIKTIFKCFFPLASYFFSR